MDKSKKNNPKQEKTLVLIKPDGVKRGLIGEIIRRIEQRGLKIIALQMLWATAEEADKHYPQFPENIEWFRKVGLRTLENYKQYGYDALQELGTEDPVEIGKLVKQWNIDYLISGPIVKMIVQGVHAVDMLRKLVGDTSPAAAEMGTIRGDFSVDSPMQANGNKRAMHNLVHASGSIEEANKEISLWFSESEIHEYNRAEEDIMF